MAADPRRILLSRDHAEDEDVDEEMPLADSALMMQSKVSHELPTNILPSPLLQHNSGPTALRFRNALGRVQSDPTTDTEAWQALLTEVQVCYDGLDPHAMDGDTARKLEWVESCYGTLLHYFPYSSYAATVATMLLKRSARLGEEHGPPYGRPEASRPMMEAQAKLEHLLTKRLGVDLEFQAGKESTSGMLVWMVDLWLVYVKAVIRNATRHAQQHLPLDQRTEYVHKQGILAYKTAAPYAGHVSKNDVFWNAYLAFVGTVNPSNANAANPTAALTTAQMTEVRAVYQELLVIPMTGLDSMWTNYEAWERSQSAALAQALTQEFLPKYQHARSVYLERLKVCQESDLQMGRLATEPATSDNLAEEYPLLLVWNKRLSYERTNPCRYSASELIAKIRTLYKLQASVLMRHPEAWHAWATWEGHDHESRRAVLQRAQHHLPDCTLLAYAEAQLLERNRGTMTTNDDENDNDNGDENDNENSLKTGQQVMEAFLERAPNSLAFVLYQQMVRRNEGMEAARQVFARARRVLRTNNSSGGGVGGSTENTAAEKVGEDEAAGATGAAATGGTGDATTSQMVTNRIHVNGNAAVGSMNPAAAGGVNAVAENGQDGPPAFEAGPITWHLYAAHAHLEHRTNRQPRIARKIYQLGLQHHAEFLTSPRYCQMYAQVLLELDDVTNLQALLTRAVAATTDPIALQALWDLKVQVSASVPPTENRDEESESTRMSLEQQRWAALHSSTQDVATGGLLGQDTTVVGAQKISIHEQLVRLEGFDTSSAIVNGLQRQVDLLELQGFWGRGGVGTSAASPTVAATTSNAADLAAGGASDTGFCQRLEFQRLAQQGLSASAGVDRRVGSAVAGVVPGLPAASTMMMAIQSMPDWLRPLCLILPATRLRVSVVPKPPPHLVEQAMAALKANPLPAERPADSKRKHGADDDDSDDDGPRGSGGYGSQFRARQRARMSVAS